MPETEDGIEPDDYEQDDDDADESKQVDVVPNSKLLEPLKDAPEHSKEDGRT